MFSEAAHLHLGELIAMRPRNLRGALGPGGRGPGGDRPGKGRALSLDFDGVSPYRPGDDIRRIDWRASLRTGETQTRRFAAESHRARMIALDLRPDLFFGVSDRLMAKTAALAAAHLAWTALERQEPLGLALPGADLIQPRRGRGWLMRILDAVAAAYQAPQSAGPQWVEDAAAPLSRQDELCLISDLPVDPAPLAALGRRLSPIRTLIFVEVEEPALALPAPDGAYPSRDPGGAVTAPRIRRGGDRPGLDAALHARRRALRDAGWEIAAADHAPPRPAPPDPAAA